MFQQKNNKVICWNKIFPSIPMAKVQNIFFFFFLASSFNYLGQLKIATLSTEVKLIPPRKRKKNCP